ncbi:hypothetical protein ACP4OV_009338 [Aristida adscensionis]
MVKFTPEDLHKAIGRTNNIRTLYVADQGGKLTASLVAAAGIISQEVASDVAMTNISADEAEQGLTIEPAVSLYYEMSDTSLRYYKGERDGNGFLINLTNSAGRVELSSEDMCVLHMSDGILVISDCIDGLCTQTETVLQKAVVDRISPVLCLENMDRYFLELQFDGEEAYKSLSHIIDSANAIIEASKDRLLNDVLIRPERGNVAFSAGSQGWAFTLKKFAQMYSSKFNLDEPIVMEKLWGENFFDLKTKKWTTKDTGAPTCKRGFVQFCYQPLKTITEMCMDDQKDKLWLALLKLGVKMKDDDKELTGKNLMERVLQTWLSCSCSLLEMMVLHLPSPVRAQEYRVKKLYGGPPDDLYANAIKGCDARGPLMLYISKMIPASDKGRFFAFGRVFSGSVTTGKKVRIFGPNYVPGKQKDLYVQTATCTVACYGKRQLCFKDVPCGNTVVMVGLDVAIGANSTLTNEEEIYAYPIRDMKLSLLADESVKDEKRNSTKALNNQAPKDFILKAVGNRRGKAFRIPYSIYNILYPHQREALQWLWTIHSKETGAIIADDMGLGKTLEVSAFLFGLFYSGLIERAMIVVPITVLPGWGLELDRVGLKNWKEFTNPIGKADQVALNSIMKQGGLLLTTYETFRDNNEAILGRNKDIWDYVFADEGHRIKNMGAAITKSLNGIHCLHKLIITGTPFQNSLREFFTLMQFCCPNLLGDYRSFCKKYIYPIDRGKHRNASEKLKKESSEASDSLKKLINPYILRRTKELLKATGRLTCNKHELTVWLKPSLLQMKLIKVLLGGGILNFHEDLGSPLIGSTIYRSICNHPAILMGNECLLTEESDSSGLLQRILKQLIHTASLGDLCAHDYDLSCKLSFIMYLVPKLLEDGKKILIFSQSPMMLQIVQNALLRTVEEAKVIRMVGSTKDKMRKKLIKDFQRHEKLGPTIFLMSTTVGGLGITLTKASRVIIIDPARNPSDDCQAVDRAYRVGQLEDVIIYRLITCGTIEEHIYRKQISKGEISTALLERQCERGIDKKKKKVLSLPMEGFGTSVTYQDLCSIYGNKFSEVLRSDLSFVEKHKSVVSVGNHSLLFSVQEKLSPVTAKTSSPKVFRQPQYKKASSDAVTNGDNENFPRLQLHNTKDSVKKDGVDREEEGPKAKGSTRRRSTNDNMVSSGSKTDKMEHRAMIEVPNHIMPHLIGQNQKKIEEFRRRSGAVIGISSRYVDYQTVQAIGSFESVEKARKLINDFVKPLEGDLIYVQSDKLESLVGKKGDNLNNIKRVSGARIKVGERFTGLKQVRVWVSGNEFQKKVALEMIDASTK